MPKLYAVDKKTIKMRVDTTKSWFAMGSTDKLVFFSRHFNI